MEERSAGELPQYGRPLGVHDSSGGTVSDVDSGRSERSGTLAFADGLELDRNGFGTLLTSSNRWGSLTGKGTTFDSIR